MKITIKDHFTVEMIVSGVIMGGTGNIKQIDYLITDATITTMAAPTGSLWGTICKAALPKFN